MADFEELEDILEYKFKNEQLLIEALTHSSYSNEKKCDSIKNNERFEFLGDSVLGIVVSDHIFNNYTNLPEGELTKVRSKVVCEATLGEISKSKNIGKYMLFGRGEEMTGGRQRISILADAFEALVAAIYLDGGIEPARNCILNLLSKKIEDAINGKVFLDYKTHLQEIIQVNKDNKLKYAVVDESGPDHCKIFFVDVYLNDKVIGSGQGRSKKEAEQASAKMAIEGIEAVE